MVEVVSQAGSFLVTNAVPGCVGPSSEKHCAKRSKRCILETSRSLILPMISVF